MKRLFISSFLILLFLTTTPTAYALSIQSHYLTATNFGFSIPSTATINGVLIEVQEKKFGSSGADVDYIRITVYYTAAAPGSTPQFQIKTGRFNVKTGRIIIKN